MIKMQNLIEEVDQRFLLVGNQWFFCTLEPAKTSIQ